MAQETKAPIKINRSVSGKSFKLIDFHFYDQRANNLDQDISTGSDESSSGSGQGLAYSPDYVPPPTSTGANPNTPKFIIQMFGLNEKGETCCMFVSNYSPFFYIRVGDDWKKNDVNALLREIKTRLGKFHSQSIIGIELVEHHKLYGFTGGKKHQFAKLTFKNVMAMNKTKNLWYTYLNEEERASEVAQGSREYRRLTPLVFKDMALELYESTIPPLLRYFHIYEISPSGWVFISTTKAKIPPIRTTTCTYEYICTTGQIKSRPEKETRVPYKICSFDIEASSSHGDFPLPIKTYKRLASNIADVFRQMSSPPNPPLDAVRAKSLLKRLILTAFGLDNFDNIDLVYPKLAIDRTKVVALFEKLCVTPIKNAKMANTEEEDNSHLLDIDRIFEQIKDSAKAAFGKGTASAAAALAGSTASTANGTDGNDNDGDDDDDDEDDGVMIADLESARSCQELDVAPVWTAAKSRAANIPASKKLSKTELSATIIDVLLNPKYDRETKINLTNETLTLIGFPRLKGDEVTFIGSTFLRYGEAEPYLNHCLVVGSCSPVDNAVIQSVDSERELLLKWRELMQSENPDIIIGYNIFGFDYEFMFRRSQEIGCTTEFLQLSRKVGEVCAKAPYNFGQGPSDGPDDGSDDSISKLMLENTKIVLASGEYDLRFPKMMGRLQIDMYTYFRKDFNLASYKLDDVAGQFISDDIKHIVHSDHPRFGPTTELFSSNLTGLRPGDFIHLELSSFTADYYKNGKKFRVLDIIKGRELEEIVKGKMVKNKYNIIVIGGTETIDMSKAKNVKWTMAKDDVSPQDIFRLAKGSADDRAIVAKYCIQDCNLVHHLMSKIDVITGYVEMSRICSVPISYLVLRGQGIKLTSYVAKKCREKNTLMPDLEKLGNSDGYEGAIVLPPKCSMYMDNPVACVDYASLYPSSMISQNYSHDSKVWTKEYDLTGRLVRETGEKSEGIGAVDQSVYKYDNLPGYIYIDIEFDTYRSVRKTPTSRAEKVVSGKKVCRWAQLPDNQKSIMPAILEELLDARKKTRKQIKTEPDPFMQNILDKRQLGYKVTANSLYGQCGARTSTFFEQDVAASTTATGRQMITYAKRMIEEVYGDRIYETTIHGPVKCKAEYVYGDTDSVFFTFNLENPQTGEKIRGKTALEMTIEIAQDVAGLCSQFLKSPMELTYEKTLMPFILLSKKRYVGMLYETDANKGKLKYMGLSLKRRDSCDYLKDTYGGLLNILMRENNIQAAIDFLNQSLENLVRGVVPMDKLIISKALRSDYKNPMQIGHWVLADRIGKRDPGNKPKPGDRMKFVFIIPQTSSGGGGGGGGGKGSKAAAKKVLMGDKIETPEYVLEHKIQIDYTHYITNQLMKPLQQLLGLALVPIWEHQRKTSTIMTFKKDVAKLEAEYPDIEEFMKKREKYCSAKVKALLFDKILNKIENSRLGAQEITGFFGKSN